MRGRDSFFWVSSRTKENRGERSKRGFSRMWEGAAAPLRDFSSTTASLEVQGKAAPLRKFPEQPYRWRKERKLSSGDNLGSSPSHRRHHSRTRILRERLPPLYGSSRLHFQEHKRARCQRKFLSINVQHFEDLLCMDIHHTSHLWNCFF